MSAIAPVHRLSLSAVPKRERDVVLRDVLGPMLNLDFTLLSDGPAWLDCRILSLPGVSVTHLRSAAMKTRWLLRAGARDEFMLDWSPTRGRGMLRHVGREVTSSTGECVLTLGHEPVESTLAEGFDPVQIRIDRTALLAVAPHAEDRLMEPLARSSTAFRLLDAYVRTLWRNGGLVDASTAPAVVAHLADLVALVIGAPRDAAAAAGRRGGRSARLAAIKAWTQERLTDPGLSVTTAAAAQGVSPRYVQMLLREEHVTFSGYVLHERLALAHRLLADPSHAHRSISSIAFGCGVGDLSWFNRAFRAKYGEAPGDVRQHAIEAAKG